MTSISSRRHPMVNAFRELADSPDALGVRLLLDGVHLVRDAQAAGLEFEVVGIAAEQFDSDSEEGTLGRALERDGVEVMAVSPQAFRAMSPVRTPSGIVAVARRVPASLDTVCAHTDGFILIAVDVQDPGNLGSLVRAAEAGGVTGVLVSGSASASPFSWKAVRGSMGSALRLPIVAGVALSTALAALTQYGVRTVAAVPRSGRGPDDIDWTGAVGLLVGGEGAGLDADVVSRCAAQVSIPMTPPVESLNVAAATAVLVYAARRQRVRSTGPDPERGEVKAMSSLFDDDPDGQPGAAPLRDAAAGTPLAERIRPRTLDDVVGQDEILAAGRPLREAIERDLVQSIILWGPPGTGKTTLARIIAEMTRAHFVPFSAVMAGIKEIKEVMAAARLRRRSTGRRTIVFVDEIHRFNKAQQDAFLPRVESGDIVLIGATTENPSFEVNAALLSRSKVFVLQALDAAAIEQILRRALTDTERGLGTMDAEVSDAAIGAIARFANGDARSALNLLEFSLAAAPIDPDTMMRRLDLPQLEHSIQRRALLYDKGGEEHYNLISALHKSMRNSDPDAAVYWVARMLEAGEDPLYVARRLVRFASEDVGNADPQALIVTIAAKDACHFMGMPEGNTALAQAAIYLATAPKSNAVYKAYGAAAADAHTQAADPVPLHLRNAPTALMKSLNYGRDYQYAHDEPDAIAAMDCLPASLAGRKYYNPSDRGFEKEIKRRLDGWEQIKNARRRP